MRVKGKCASQLSCCGPACLPPSTSSLPDRQSRCAGGDGPHLPTALQLTGTVTHPAGKAALAGELLGFACPRRPVLPAWPKPGGPVSPAPMESVDRWPLASITAQIPGGRPSVVAAVRRRDRGRLPSFRGADAAAGPRLFWALGRVSCERTVPGELSGGNWNGREGPAVRPRASLWPGACRPCQR